MVAIATIAGAYLFQFGLGYQPCRLCLEQRIPYYLAMPVALVTALLAGAHRLAAAGLALLAAIFLVSAGLGAYHAGVEWALWPGPADCGAVGAADPASMSDFLSRLKEVRVVSCTDAAWRFLGLSLAGWNVVISLALAGLAALGARRALARTP